VGVGQQVEHNFRCVSLRTEDFIRYVASNKLIKSDQLGDILDIDGVEQLAGRPVLDVPSDWHFIQRQAKRAMSPGEYAVAKDLLRALNFSFFTLMHNDTDTDQEEVVFPMPEKVVIPMPYYWFLSNLQ